MISLYILLTIGLILMVSEILIGSFYLIFCGLSFLIVGIVSFFVDIQWYFQLFFICILSLSLVFILRKPLLSSTSKENSLDKNFLDEGGFGVIKEGMLYYKGTLWGIENLDINTLKDGQRVEIIRISKDNKAIVKI